MTWLKQCPAISAFSGRRCGLLAHAPGTVHRHGRTEFTAVAAPGETRFPLREALELFSHALPESEALTLHARRRATYHARKDE